MQLSAYLSLSLSLGCALKSSMATLTSSLNTPQKAKLSTPARPLQPNSTFKVRVAVRVRPFLPHEIESQNGSPVSCVSVLDQEFESGEEIAVYLKDQFTSRNECYKLDSFFGQDDNNLAQIFYREVCPLVPGIFYGCNATVFAYGATGTGKTYTMQGTDEFPGLIPLTMATVLSMCQSTGSTAEVSYYQVYMERCIDLLERKEKEIAVMDDKDGQVHLRGLSRVAVSSMSEFHEVFSRGIQRRTVAQTGLNDVSSRSHGVLVISVSTPCGDGAGAAVVGKLNLIDLAGNEDNGKTHNEGIRLQESAKINQSLFALSNVIYALNNNKPRVPYRESKLTRILQDSLGGTSRALMVACLNPGEYQESVHTISLAARSRHISNFVSSAQKQETPKVKVDMEAKLRAWLESKGKTKSAQRIGAFGSPFLTRTPSSVSSVKKTSMLRSNAKAKEIVHQVASTARDRPLCVPFRNLFSSIGRDDSHMEINCHKDMEDSRESGTRNGNCITAAEDGDLRNNSTMLPEDYFNNSSNCLGSAAEDNTREEILAAANGVVLELRTTSPDDEQVEKDMMTKSANSVRSSPTSEGRIKVLQSSLRKVLSPIDANVSRRKPFEEDILCRDEIASFEPTTPQTPSIANSENNRKFQSISSLDKFNARSSNLKGSLLKEYIDFLNSASKEELVEIKGIGLKRAEYIIELREESPLKSLSDLEKMGLSSKQVHNLFGRAARGIFG
ncbi:kinesin-like protein KIN-10C [Malania oleifera]|uniref:kinesin-like protein KIN-10C n=1 Tax=Malania oleifera TaxID=397392 RepID=UPI0025AE9850|nr:kinesin-like protein KIN-10C [Malania oleifera]